MKPTGTILAKLSTARARRTLFLEYAQDRLLERDYHGVADAAMDLREIQHEIDILEWVLEEA